jgi:hypothetical protein
MASNLAERLEDFIAGSRSRSERKGLILGFFVWGIYV